MAQTLKQQYETLCNEYLKIFCEKQEVEFDPSDWVGGDVGEVIHIADCFLNFDEIRLDIDTDQPKGFIFKWYWEDLDGYYKTKQRINYRNYIKGLRHGDLLKNEAEIDNIERVVGYLKGGEIKSIQEG